MNKTPQFLIALGLFAALTVGQVADARVFEGEQSQNVDQALKTFVAPSKAYKPEDEETFNKRADYADEASSAITRALRQVEAHESVLPASRYVVRGWLKYVGDQTQLQLEITRHNHGKRITAELQRDYGENAREALASDDLPNVRHRMGIMQVPMTQQFDALMPHRLALADDAKSTCLRVPCLKHAMDDAGEPIPPLAKAKAAPHQAQADHQRAMGLVLPHWSWMAEALMKEAGLHRGLDEMETREGESDQPDFVLRLDDGLFGQDDNHHGVLCQYDVMDDAIKDICWEVLAVPGAKPIWRQYVLPREPHNNF